MEKVLRKHLPEEVILNDTHVQMSRILVDGMMRELRRLAKKKPAEFYNLAVMAKGAAVDPVELHKAMEHCFAVVNEHTKTMIHTVLYATIREDGPELYLGCPYDFERSFLGTEDVFDHRLWFLLLGVIGAVTSEVEKLDEGQGRVKALQFDLGNTLKAGLKPKIGTIYALADGLQTTGGLALCCNQGVPTVLLSPFGELKFCTSSEVWTFAGPNGMSQHDIVMRKIRERGIEVAPDNKLQLEDGRTAYVICQFGENSLPELELRKKKLSRKTLELAWAFHEQIVREQDQHKCIREAMGLEEKAETKAPEKSTAEA